MAAMYEITGQDADGVLKLSKLTLGEALERAAEAIENGGVKVEIKCPYGITYDEASIRNMIKTLQRGARPRPNV